MGSISYDSEIAEEVLPYLRVYKDGTIDRLVGTDVVPATLNDPKTGVSSKDVLVIPETGVTARLYRPNHLTKTQKLPLVIYFHGGAFCIASPAEPFYHNCLNLLVAEAKVVALSVDYRLAPENSLPAAYEDSWAVLKWVAAHVSGEGSEDWIKESVDFSRVFLSGDSAGANISHHMAMRAGNGELPRIGLEFKGIVMIHPYFWGEDPIGVEGEDLVRKGMVDKWWRFVCPSNKGCDDPLINPYVDAGFGESLAGLCCDRIIIFVAENDILVERGRQYYEFLTKKSKWQGKAEIVETPGEDHVFHLFYPDSEKARLLIKRCASFINQV